MKIRNLETAIIFTITLALYALMTSCLGTASVYAEDSEANNQEWIQCGQNYTVTVDYNSWDRPELFFKGEPFEDGLPVLYRVTVKHLSGEGVCVPEWLNVEDGVRYSESSLLDAEESGGDYVSKYCKTRVGTVLGLGYGDYDVFRFTMRHFWKDEEGYTSEDEWYWNHSDGWLDPSDDSLTGQSITVSFRIDRINNDPPKKVTPRKYTVKYNLNGGKGTFSKQTKTHNKKLKLRSKKPSRIGYNFLGWSTKKNGKVVYKAGGVYKKNANTTLYAKWKRNNKTYNISKSKYQIKQVKYNGKAQKPAFTLTYSGQKLKASTDYKIVKWNNNKNAGKGTVKIKGVGVFKGTKTLTFTIKKGDFALSARPSSISTDSGSIGKKQKITVSSGKSSKIAYTSTNAKVATVSKGGYVTIKGVGNARITAKATPTNKNYNSRTVSVGVKVIEKKQSQKIELPEVYDTANGWYIAPYDSSLEYYLNPKLSENTAVTYTVQGGSAGTITPNTNRIDVKKNGEIEVKIRTAETKKYVATEKTFKLFLVNSDFSNNYALLMNNDTNDGWDFPSFAKPVDNSYTIPGLCKSAKTPQGVCVTDKYILISCYNAFKKQPVKNSSIIVLSRDGDYLTEFELKLDDNESICYDSYSHVGGLAYDSDSDKQMVYIADSDDYTSPSTDGSYSNVIWKLSQHDIDRIVQTGAKVGVASIAFVANSDASWLTYYNGFLYVGTFRKDTASYMQAYRESAGNQYSAIGSRIELPKKTQGVGFYSRDDYTYALCSLSYGRFEESTLNVSKVKLNGEKMVTSLNNTSINVYMPNMSEDLYISGKSMYILFESAAYQYAHEEESSQGKIKRPLDRLLRLDLTRLDAIYGL